jgi:hypothetical protein
MAYDRIECLAEDVQGPSPSPHPHEVQHRVDPEDYRVEVIMSDRVPPNHQLVEQFPPPAILGVVCVNVIPEW